MKQKQEELNQELQNEIKDLKAQNLSLVSQSQCFSDVDDGDADVSTQMAMAISTLNIELQKRMQDHKK